ncbi:hypothetical protein COV53_01585 [Candidatus Gottesmanbacteria bacterium CG11_big_fil_rev_8_21_14_0_20_37_11]|uniref:Uncharacterized protein n=1 Tax=Candidatus Gottesmanbacteria bacterium CG11_big_fil_rev_8_21_14_0_20_37_11 TaxID=1974575 RepID=A0A2H0NIK5_9BACT|nr:MAG: hypothetical protein COV53_01585 [Candidatus Gottesmanbacteria bacterium CG11_big_fil_rev_8_21_14_0_20_37_11]
MPVWVSEGLRNAGAGPTMKVIPESPVSAGTRFTGQQFLGLLEAEDITSQQLAIVMANRDLAYALPEGAADLRRALGFCIRRDIGRIMEHQIKSANGEMGLGFWGSETDKQNLQLLLDVHGKLVEMSAAPSIMAESKE